MNMSTIAITTEQGALVLIGGLANARPLAGVRYIQMN